MLRLFLSVSAFVWLFSTVAFAQEPRLRRVIELPEPYGSEGTFLVVGQREQPPADSDVIVVRNDHHISRGAETPAITPARHYEVVFGPASRGTISGVLLPCRPSSVRRHRVVWIRDRLHGDHRWRRADEASAEGACRMMALPIAATFLRAQTQPVAVVARPTANDSLRQIASNALGATQVTVYDDLGVGVYVARYAENDRWWFARFDSAGDVVRFGDQHVVMASRVGFGGPVAICAGGDSFLFDRLWGPTDPEYRLLHVGRCGSRFDDS